MPDRVRLTIDDREIEVTPGTTVGAAILNAGTLVFRRSTLCEPRSPLCGMGVCFECRVTVDGIGGVRSCTLPCRDGMRVETGQ